MTANQIMIMYYLPDLLWSFSTVLHIGKGMFFDFFKSKGSWDNNSFHVLVFNKNVNTWVEQGWRSGDKKASFIWSTQIQG